MLRALTLITAFMSIFGCSTITYEHIPTPTEKDRKFYLFLDGTANDAISRTNVSKLHALVTLQNDPNTVTLYVDGVGTERTGKAFGLGLGLGNAKRVKKAYLFLAENYKKDDQLYIFGFSRGAWSSRVLASLLYVAGIPDIKHLPESKREEVVDNIYNKYKKFWSTLNGDDRSLSERRKAVFDYLREEKLSNNRFDVDVDFLGLWDTVQALGIEGNSNENVGEPNARYADQLCNIKRVAHAVSIDDNRFDEFTPLLFKQKHFSEEECLKVNIKGEKQPKPIQTVINEVWFSGAHSDVGGGYNDTTIHGISLNWMLNEMERANIIKKGIEVYANHLDKTHNPNSGWLGIIYGKPISRSLRSVLANNYVNPSMQHVNETAKIKLHPSVLDRLCVKAPETFESMWFREEGFEGCVVCEGNKGSLSNAKRCNDILEVEKNDDKYKPDENLISQNLCQPSDCDLANVGDTTTRNLSPIKSCNLSLNETQEQAHQRLNTITLDGEIKKRARVTYFIDRKDDRTGVILKAGQTYKLIVENVRPTYKDGTEYEVKPHVWLQDCSYQSGLAGRGIWDKSNTEDYRVDNFFKKGITSLFRLSFQDMFEDLTTVIGKVKGHSIIFHDVLRTDEYGRKIDEQLTGVFSVPDSGELVMTVNEPFFNSFAKGEFFSNNSGVITFSIETIDEL